MGATERVVQFIEYKGISKYKFCKDLGFSNKFLDNSSNMGTDKACKILHYFPEINPEWLLTGKGEMIKSKQGGEVEKSKNLIPFYDDVATVGGTDLVADTYNAVSVA
ncbi:helix-turn-helix domain-containing protein, partial [Riemerella anatipestifer]|nr:helix-turn-helix domain-containing protein [Riemerella anatipestifer]